MAEINLKQPKQIDRVRFAPTGRTQSHVSRRGNTFHFSEEVDGYDYSGPSARFYDYGSITLTNAEIAAIEARTDQFWEGMAMLISGGPLWARMAVVKRIKSGPCCKMHG